jgi:hypothetical protein
LQRHPLGCQLAHHQGDIGQRHHDQHDRAHLGRRAQKPQRLDQRLDQHHRRRRGQEPGQGDADLDGGQELVGIAGQPGDQAALPALLVQPLQLPLPQQISAISLPANAAFTSTSTTTNPA